LVAIIAGIILIPIVAIVFIFAFIQAVWHDFWHGVIKGKTFNERTQEYE
jgi:hypothetical protein